MTAQELYAQVSQDLFTKVATHLLTQNARSLDETLIPAYRGLEGRTCAIGCLISDADYTLAMEAQCVTAGVVWSALRFPEALKGLLSYLQSIHDMTPVADWPETLAAAALIYNLTPVVVSTPTRFGTICNCTAVLDSAGVWVITRDPACQQRHSL